MIHERFNQCYLKIIVEKKIEKTKLFALAIYSKFLGFGQLTEKWLFVYWNRKMELLSLSALVQSAAIIITSATHNCSFFNN